MLLDQARYIACCYAYEFEPYVPLEALTEPINSSKMAVIPILDAA